jgi:hypothetical protein
MQHCFGWFPDDEPLGIQTHKNILCDSVIYISKKQYCAFCWYECCESVIDNARNEQYKVYNFHLYFAMTPSHTPQKHN